MSFYPCPCHLIYNLFVFISSDLHRFFFLVALCFIFIFCGVGVYHLLEISNPTFIFIISSVASFACRNQSLIILSCVVINSFDFSVNSKSLMQMASIQQYILYFNILSCQFSSKLKKIMMEEKNKM